MAKAVVHFQPRIINQIIYYNTSNVVFNKTVQWININPNTYYCTTNVFLKYYDTYGDHYSVKSYSKNEDWNIASAYVAQQALITKTSELWSSYANTLTSYLLDFKKASTLYFERRNSNIYKNIFDSFLFDLYDFQTIFNDPYKQETATFQYNHGFQVYDLLRLNQDGLYEKGIATESKYDVIGMVTKVLNDHEFILTTYGQIKTNINFDSDSGILYLSDTQEGKFCSYEELVSNFYTPIGFYTGNTITLNILDSSVGEVLKKYHDTIYEYEQSLPYITETEKQDIIQEVLNNA
jgi:hypothetical protein